MSRPHSHRASRIPADGERFNERPFVDLCDVVDVRENRYWWLVAVGQHTDYTAIAPCPSHESQSVAKKIFKQLDSVGRTRGRDATESEASEHLRFSLKSYQFQKLWYKQPLRILRGRRAELRGGLRPSRK